MHKFEFGDPGEWDQGEIIGIIRGPNSSDFSSMFCTIVFVQTSICLLNKLTLYDTYQ